MPLSAGAHSKRLPPDAAPPASQTCESRVGPRCPGSPRDAHTCKKRRLHKGFFLLTDAETDAMSVHPGLNDSTYVREADGSYRTIVVVLTERRGGEFSFNEISEASGPVEKDCPERLLRVASPLNDGRGAFGPEWRNACRARRTHTRQAKASNPKPGDTFRTLKPVNFRDGTSHSAFTCRLIRQRGRMATVYAAKGSSALYRFRPATFGFEIISIHTTTESRR